jgi:hypothetical protein
MKLGHAREIERDLEQVARLAAEQRDDVVDRALRMRSWSLDARLGKPARQARSGLELVAFRQLHAGDRGFGPRDSTATDRGIEQRQARHLPDIADRANLPTVTSGDTSPDAESVRTELYRRMSPNQRSEIAAEMSATTRAITLENIRRRHPTYDEHQALDSIDIQYMVVGSFARSASGLSPVITKTPIAPARAGRRDACYTMQRHG